MADSRESDIVRAFVQMASSLVMGDDVADLLSGLVEECTRLLGISSAGLLLADHAGRLHVMAATNNSARDLELFSSQSEEGPCRDAHETGAAVLVPDLSLTVQRWPAFVPAALAAGLRSVHAVPLRMRDTVLGAMGLFNSEAGDLAKDDLDLAQALADVASIALVQNEAYYDQQVLVDQLQSALDSRVVLERATGMLSHAGGLDMGAAFECLRRYARNHNIRLTQLAESVTRGEIAAGIVVKLGKPKRP